MSEHAQKVQKPSDVGGESGSHETEQDYPSLAPALSTSLAQPRAIVPDEILQLQRIIGNHAVLRLVQREVPDSGTATPAAVLDAGQIASARRRYEAQSQRYTPQIIQQIEAAVERPQNGQMDDDDIQAVARFQQAHPPLEVDGFPGPHTLSVMFPFGLSEQESIETYTGEFASLQSQWRTLSPQARLDQLRELIGRRMTEAGVTPATIVEADLGHGDTWGAFDYQTWTLEISRRLLSRADLQDSDARALMETVYHEARHAEQYFTIARWLAGQGMGADAIRARMGLNDLPVIAAMLQAAVTNPIQANTPEAILAEDWYTSFYGRRRAETIDTYGDIGRRDRQLAEAEVEHSLNPADPAAAGREARASERFDTSWEEYHDLPMEFDAHRMDERVDESYSRQTGRRSDSEIVDEALEGTGF